MITVRNAINAILPEKEALECIKWAEEKGHHIIQLHLENESRHMAETLVKKWQKASAALERWGNIHVPSLEGDSITIVEMHAYLTDILTLHPDIGTIPLYHEECCGKVRARAVEFNYEKNQLDIY